MSAGACLHWYDAEGLDEPVRCAREPQHGGPHVARAAFSREPVAVWGEPVAVWDAE